MSHQRISRIVPGNPHEDLQDIFFRARNKERNSPFFVYSPNDRNDQFRFDPSSARIWSLQSHNSDWNEAEAVWRLATERTLYRLSDRRWYLIEQKWDFEARRVDAPTYRVLSDREAAEELLPQCCGFIPDDVIHYIREGFLTPCFIFKTDCNTRLSMCAITRTLTRVSTIRSLTA